MTMTKSDMRRIKLTIEYDGTDYAGWQRQENAMTVQQKTEEALAKLLHEKVTLTGASRTDAGVHALGQVAHFDTDSPIPDDKFQFALNTMLPWDIRIRDSVAVDDDFHSRFCAKGKVYRYMIYNSRHASALLRRTHSHEMYPIDIERMDREAQAMVGTHDFAAFAASGSVVKDTVRTIYACRCVRNDDEIALLVYGNGFLYNMVRILAGTLCQVGNGKIEEGAIKRALETNNRLQLGITAPPQGLTLMQVFYENEENKATEMFNRLVRKYDGQSISKSK